MLFGRGISAMSEIPARAAPEGEVLLAPLPATAVQALYHAATGKTETLEKLAAKNFILRKNDLDQLRFKVLQQLAHFETIAGPTITVKVRFYNSENQQFSSWDRFQIFDSGKTEIVSDVVVKFEFVIKLPEIPNPQRYILTVDLDSKLPVIINDRADTMGFGWLRLYSALESMPSLTISIDFIDYLCAKNFVQIVEDWFNSLEESPPSRWRTKMANLAIPWRLLFTRIAILEPLLSLHSTHI
jgi:hypothetical protein